MSWVLEIQVFVLWNCLNANATRFSINFPPNYAKKDRGKFLFLMSAQIIPRRASQRFICPKLFQEEHPKDLFPPNYSKKSIPKMVRNFKNDKNLEDRMKNHVKLVFNFISQFFEYCSTHHYP